LGQGKGDLAGGAFGPTDETILGRRRVVIETREQWRTWVTPKRLRTLPFHRWYAFPHSFTGELVSALIDEWDLTDADHILDPFVGAGTTLLAAKTKGIPAHGSDLSPFAVFVSNTKARDYSIGRLECLWQDLSHVLRKLPIPRRNIRFPDLVEKALPQNILRMFVSIDDAIGELHTNKSYIDFFRLALLAILPRYSRAEATGGWLKWTTRHTNSKSISTVFTDRVEMMLDDVRQSETSRDDRWKATMEDARRLSGSNESMSAIITSPPYPNRHDYTRVFGVELMFGFLNWEQTRALRYQSIQSHPEARPERPNFEDYSPPKRLEAILSKMQAANLDTKILQMLRGYFTDMHLCLRECMRLLKSGGRIAFVVGNAQYRGCRLLVDELIAEIGTAAGLKLDKILAVRFRGNSAQQMGEFGRRPSRESVVVFQKAGTPNGSRRADCV
jgi:hypothetical protein